MGRTHVWNLAGAYPAHPRCTVLGHPKCTAAVRDAAVSPDGATIVCECDGATGSRLGGAAVGLVCGQVVLLECGAGGP